MSVIDSRHTVHPGAVTVLLVDDHPALRAGLGELLIHTRGFDCAGAVSAPQQLGAVLERSRPDVVLLDDTPDPRESLTACLTAKQRSDRANR